MLFEGVGQDLVVCPKSLVSQSRCLGLVANAFECFNFRASVELATVLFTVLVSVLIFGNYM